MKIIYSKKLNKNFNVVLFFGTFQDLNIARARYQLFFEDVSFSIYNYDLIDRVVNKDWILANDHNYLFVMGDEKKDFELVSKVKKVLDEQHMNVLDASINTFSDLKVKIKPNSGRHKCYCDRKVLFDYGCQCGGQ